MVRECRGQGRTPYAAWRETGKARRELRADRASTSHRKSFKIAGGKLARFRAEAVQVFLEKNVRNLEAHIREEGDQAGFYQHLVGKVTYSSHYIQDEDGNLLRDIDRISARWARRCHTVLSTKSPNLDTAIIDHLKLWPPWALGAVSLMAEIVDAVRSMPNTNAVDPDELPAEPLKLSLDDDDDNALVDRFHDTAVAVGNGGGVHVPHKSKDAALRIQALYKKEGSDRVG